MKSEIKAKWVAALRSKKYEQGRKHLRSRGEFCCLGVLCDLHAQETGNAWIPGDAEKYLDRIGDLPPEVMKWSGLPLCYGETVEIAGTSVGLDTHNDNGRSFKEIADAIERQL